MMMRSRPGPWLWLSGRRSLFPFKNNERLEQSRSLLLSSSSLSLPFKEINSNPRQWHTKVLSLSSYRYNSTSCSNNNHNYNSNLHENDKGGNAKCIEESIDSVAHGGSITITRKGNIIYTSTLPNNLPERTRLSTENFPYSHSSRSRGFSFVLKLEGVSLNGLLSNYKYNTSYYYPSCRWLSTTTRTTSSSSSSPLSQTKTTPTKSTGSGSGNNSSRNITSSSTNRNRDNVVGIKTNKRLELNENFGGDHGGRGNSNTDPEEPLAMATRSELKPAGVQHNWDLRTYTPKNIADNSQDVISQLKKYFDTAANAEQLSFDTVLKPLLEAHRYSFTNGAVVTFPRHVAESPEIRDAATQATKVLDESSVEMSMRKDVFDKLVEYKENFSAADNLSPEYQRCLDRLIHTGRRNGLHLSEDVREKVKEIKKQMSQLTLQFSRNLGEENTELLFSNEELEGMPTTFLEGLEKDAETGKFKVSLKYPHFFPVTRKCRVPATRKKLEIAYQSKCMEENTKLLEEVLELRQREAELLGYANHAAYAQDMQMAKNPDNVKVFLSDLALKLQPLWKAEKEDMLELKKRECEKYGYEYNGKLEMWDFRYYMCLIEEEKYAVDQQLLMAYFPLEHVTRGMLEIYEELLSLKFTYMPDAQKWHDDVRAYEVVDVNTSEVLGYFYLDLFPRDGKFGHACCVPLQPGCLDDKGVKQPAVSVMLTNFTRPKNNKPSLLDHKEVETYFHEFGHLMHTICSRAKSALLFGTRVETDFLEAPSQMLENWVWEKQPLRKMSLHYELKTQLPDDIIDKLTASQLANAGGFNLRQIVLATFDQRVHLQGRCDTQALYAQILFEIMGLEAIPDTNMPANFNHLCIGYSGRYYSYLWSEVFSMDMYKTVFKAKGIFNAETGLLYRRCILEPGGSVDAMDMLKTFLGREPNNVAFLESKGLTPDPGAGVSVDS